MFLFFFFNDTATTEIYTLSLHDALPISEPTIAGYTVAALKLAMPVSRARARSSGMVTDESVCSRSEEHTSELQSRQYLVCRLLLEKKKTKKAITSLTATVNSK